MYITIRVIPTVVVHYDWKLKQLNVKPTFLHGDLNEKIFMYQPKGFENKNKPNLKKSLYGLKQSSRQLYKKYDSYVLSIGFKRSGLFGFGL